MSSRASRRNDTTDIIKKIQNDNRRDQGLARQAYSGLASAEYGDNTSSSSGGSGTTSGTSGWTGNATTDLNMNTFDVISVDRLSFVEDSGVGTNVNTPQIYISSAGGSSSMVFNNDANDFTWKHSDVTSMTESSGTLKKEATISPNFILYNSRTAALGTAANLFFDAKETTTGEVSMAQIVSQTEDQTENGSGSMHLGVRESGFPINYIQLNEANDTSVRINRSLIMNTSTIFLDTDNDTYIESQTDNQLKIYSGGNNVINIKPTEILVTQPIDMLGAKVTGLATPTVDSDASTKKYVDDNIGGGGVTLGNTSPWTAIQPFNVGIDLNGADIDDVDTITFDTNNIQITGSTSGLTSTVPTGDNHYFVVAGGTKLQIGETATYSLNTLSPGTSGGAALGSSALPWAGLWCDSITASGSITTTSSLNVGGDVWLGNDAADDIHISGTMDTDINMGGNDLDFAFGGTVDFHTIVNAAAVTGGGVSAAPTNPVAFFTVKYQGATRYIPYYS